MNPLPGGGPGQEQTKALTGLLSGWLSTPEPGLASQLPGIRLGPACISVTLNPCLSLGPSQSMFVLRPEQPHLQNAKVIVRRRDEVHFRQASFQSELKNRPQNSHQRGRETHN